MCEKLNIALVGYGYWGKVVERYLRENPYFHLKTIFSPSAPDTGIFTNQISTLLNDQSVRHALIATPIGTHYDLCKKFLVNGFSVLCEKPLSRRYPKAADLAAIAKQHSVVLETNYLFTDSPTVKKMKELLSEIGTVQTLDLRMEQWGAFYRDDDVFEVLAVHMISVALFLLDGDFSQVQFEKLLLRENGVCDTGRVSFLLGETKVSIVASSRSIKKSRTITAFGSKGTVEADLMSEAKTLTMRLCDDSKIETYFFDEKNNIANALERFYEVIAQKRVSNIPLSLSVNHVLERKYA